MKKFVLGLCAGWLALWPAGCGSSTDPNAVPLTGLTKRVLLSNQQISNIPGFGAVDILDAQRDAVSTKSLAANGANKMVTAGGFTVVLSKGLTSLFIIDNAKETVSGQPALLEQPQDIAISPNGKLAYAAVRNASAVEVFNTSDGTFVASITVPTVQRLIMGPNGGKLLAFVDNPQTLPAPNANAFYVIDTVANTAAPVTGASLDQPFTAVFNGSDTKAFILNCGAECGGTAASVVPLDLTGTPVLGPTVISVSAATVGFISGSNLFVAGTPPGAASINGGTLQVINTGSLAVSGGTTAISDGQHLKLVLGSNNRLFVGASACTTAAGSTANSTVGCLRIVDVSAGTPGASGFPVTRIEQSSFRLNFDVTGIQPISGRNVVYVCEGDELDIIDTTTNTIITPNPPIDVVGKARDVVQIDP